MKNIDILGKFESTLLASLNSVDNQAIKLLDSMKYSVCAKGKRFRPKLMFASAEMLGVDATKLINLAVAIELIHTYSLIHDDLPAMDDDIYRRGVYTNHIVYGEAMAILAGDALQSIAFEEVYKAIEAGCDPLVLKYFAKYSRNMVEGQTLDIDESVKLSVDELLHVHSLKTGALIEFCMIAPLFVSKQYKYLEDLQKIGLCIGQAFQIKDDILDVTSSAEILGKTNSDVTSDKNTFATILGVDASEKMLYDVINQASNLIEKNEFYNESIEEILNYSLIRER